MPRNVRNFFVELDVDGRKSTIRTGPIRADGGFQMTVLIRDDGTVSERKLKVYGRALSDGTLKLEAYVSEPYGGDGESIVVESKR